MRKKLGNILITISLLLLLFIYLPFIKLYLFPQAVVLPEDAPYIFIPKISAAAPLVEDVNPWNKAEYLSALERGVALAQGFAKPGEKGTTFIFAHSSDTPWRITSYNTVFFRLGKLKTGDVIEINSEKQKFIYIVSHSIEVWPNEVERLTQSAGNQLILQTCTPIGTSLKRLLVFADLKTSSTKSPQID